MAWLRHWLIRRSAVASDGFSAACFRSNTRGGFHRFDLAPIVCRWIRTHAAVATVRQTKFAVIVDVDEPKSFRFPDRCSDSVAAQTIFDKLRGGDL
jgi:hypothetical protein